MVLSPFGSFAARTRWVSRLRLRWAWQWQSCACLSASLTVRFQLLGVRSSRQSPPPCLPYYGLLAIARFAMVGRRAKMYLAESTRDSGFGGLLFAGSRCLPACRIGSTVCRSPLERLVVISRNGICVPSMISTKDRSYHTLSDCQEQFW